MSIVGEAVARATRAGREAAQLAPFVHCDPLMRDAVRADLRKYGEQGIQVLTRLEASWVRVDNGQWPGARRRR